MTIDKLLTQFSVGLEHVVGNEAFTLGNVSHVIAD
jgi:hypothetical protein